MKAKLKKWYFIYVLLCVLFLSAALLLTFSPIPIFSGIIIIAIIYFAISNNGLTSGQQARANYTLDKMNNKPDVEKRRLTLGALLLIIAPPVALIAAYTLF